MTWAGGLVGIVDCPDSWGSLVGASPVAGVTSQDSRHRLHESQGRPQGRKDMSSLQDGCPVLGGWLRESGVQGSEDSQQG